MNDDKRFDAYEAYYIQSPRKALNGTWNRVYLTEYKKRQCLFCICVVLLLTFLYARGVWRREWIILYFRIQKIHKFNGLHFSDCWWWDVFGLLGIVPKCIQDLWHINYNRFLWCHLLWNQYKVNKNICSLNIFTKFYIYLNLKPL